MIGSACRIGSAGCGLSIGGDSKGLVVRSRGELASLHEKDGAEWVCQMA